MPVSNLHDLFVAELEDLYSAETQILEALPKMVSKATDEKLQEALQGHYEVTQGQRSRLDEICEMVPFRKTVTCDAIKGILLEGEKSLKDINDEATRDAAIIAAAQRVEHYEMAVYGTTEEFARKLDMGEIADMLKDTLNEEKQADSDLNGLAKGGIFTDGLNDEALKSE